MVAPIVTHDTRDDVSCIATAAYAREALRRAPVPPPYRDALAVALAMPGNVLSAAPDARWARLVWTCCAAAGGDPEQVLPLAAAVEVFMVALDLLDDVENAEQTPVLATLGTARALNVSTGLLLLALRDILGADGEVAANLLLDAALQACGGQDADLTSGAGRCGDVDEALAITSAKAAPLAAVACRLGALAAGADETTQNLYGRFGCYLGVAAQLANDIAALHPTGSPGKTDMALGRPTLPLVYATHRAHIGAVTAADADPYTALWTDGPVHLTWAVAETYRRYALDLIPRLATTPFGRDALAGLLHPL